MTPLSQSSASLADRDVQRRIVNFLIARNVPTRGLITITVRNGLVTLRGALPSAQLKYLCLNCIRRVAGVVTIVDRVHVIPNRSRQEIRSKRRLPVVTREMPSLMPA